MKRTISAMVGKGSVTHNSRSFTAENVDSERTHLNIDYCNEPIKKVYHEMFDEAQNSTTINRNARTERFPITTSISSPESRKSCSTRSSSKSATWKICRQ